MSTHKIESHKELFERLREFQGGGMKRTPREWKRDFDDAEKIAEKIAEIHAERERLVKAMADFEEQERIGIALKSRIALNPIKSDAQHDTLCTLAETGMTADEAAKFLRLIALALLRDDEIRKEYAKQRRAVFGKDNNF